MRCVTCGYERCRCVHSYSDMMSSSSEMCVKCHKVRCCCEKKKKPRCGKCNKRECRCQILVCETIPKCGRCNHKNCRCDVRRDHKEDCSTPCELCIYTYKASPSAFLSSGNVCGDLCITSSSIDFRMNCGCLSAEINTNYLLQNLPPGGQGPPGPQGPQGNTGYNGSQGMNGATGPMGPQGPIGYTGNIGATGPVGPQGPIGPSGTPGTPCRRG